MALFILVPWLMGWFWKAYENLFLNGNTSFHTHQLPARLLHLPSMRLRRGRGILHGRPAGMKSKGQAAVGQWGGGVIEMPLAVSNAQTPDSSVLSMKKHIIPHNRKPREEPQSSCLCAATLHGLASLRARNHYGYKTAGAAPDLKAQTAFSRQEKCFLRPCRHVEGIFNKRRSFPEAPASSQYSTD